MNTPWISRRAVGPDNTGGYDVAILDSEGRLIAEFFENVGYGEDSLYDKQDVVSVVADLFRAVNNYDAMLQALKFYSLAESYQGYQPVLVDGGRIARVVLEQAGDK